jgi:hypothetical protein
MREPGTFERALLRACQLSKACRDVFVLADIQGYTLAEIAFLLRISPGTALARLRRARREVGFGEGCGDRERGRLSAHANCSPPLPSAMASTAAESRAGNTVHPAAGTRRASATTARLLALILMARQPALTVLGIALRIFR